MNKKEKVITAVHEFAATNPEKEILKGFHTTLLGLDAETVFRNQTKYGTNKVTNEKKEISVETSGRCIYQSVYCNFKCFGSCFYHYRHDFPKFYAFWKYTGGF